MSNGQLHVWLHGMWAIVSTSECIELLAPEIAHDDYTFDAPGANHVLAQGTSCYLNGVARESAAARFPLDKAPVIDGLRVINRATDTVHCSVYLPHPRSVDAMRKVKIPEQFSSEPMEEISHPNAFPWSIG